MGINQNNIGNKCEKELAKLLFSWGYWVHLFQRTKSGMQPCDVVALRNNRSLLIDSKHSDTSTFNFSRIEPNQLSCFGLAKAKGVRCGFAIKYEDTWYWLGYETVNEILKDSERKTKSVYIAHLPTLEALWKYLSIRK